MYQTAGDGPHAWKQIKSPSLAEGLFFQVIKVVSDGAAIGARHLILAQSILRIGLGCGGGFLVLDGL